MFKKILGLQSIALVSDFLLGIGEILCYVCTLSVFSALNAVMIQGIGSVMLFKTEISEEAKEIKWNIITVHLISHAALYML